MGMTIEEAIKHGQEQLEIFGGEHREFIELAIKALKQEPIIDKIRAEIAELSHYYPMGHDYQIAITRCIAVIDKYRAEQEET